MKVNLIKQAGGIFFPADEMEAKRLERFKTGEMYKVDIKTTRNPQFHRKVFNFFRFCFPYIPAEWLARYIYLDEEIQFEEFRKDLTVLAGYFYQKYDPDGNMQLFAKSLAYENMEQPEFESFYTAIINAAVQNIFTPDRYTQKELEEITEKMMRFFK